MSEDLDDVTARYVDSDGKCETCGHDHSFKPTHQNVSTSIDVISELGSRCHHYAKTREILKHHA